MVEDCGWLEGCGGNKREKKKREKKKERKMNEGRRRFVVFDGNKCCCFGAGECRNGRAGRRQGMMMMLAVDVEICGNMNVERADT